MWATPDPRGHPARWGRRASEDNEARKGKRAIKEIRDVRALWAHAARRDR